MLLIVPIASVVPIAFCIHRAIFEEESNSMRVRIFYLSCSCFLLNLYTAVFLIFYFVRNATGSNCDKNHLYFLIHASTPYRAIYLKELLGLESCSDLFICILSLYNMHAENQGIHYFKTNQLNNHLNLQTTSQPCKEWLTPAQIHFDLERRDCMCNQSQPFHILSTIFHSIT